MGKCTEYEFGVLEYVVLNMKQLNSNFATLSKKIRNLFVQANTKETEEALHHMRVDIKFERYVLVHVFCSI
jgi:hypothetical protein